MCVGWDVREGGGFFGFLHEGISIMDVFFGA